MKRLIHYLAAFLLFSGSVRALDVSTNRAAVLSMDDFAQSGMEVSGVRAPYYDSEGNLRAQLYGGQARILEGGVADVTHIRIDVYEKGVEVMTVYAPQCLTRVVETGTQQALSVESDGEVLIDMAEMTIIGRGFRFTSDSSRFEILSEAKVLLKDSGRHAKGLTL